MPKTRREFIKIVLSLFNDDDFFTLRPLEQLVFIKLIACAKQKRNKIPKKLASLIDLLRLKLSASDLKVMLKRFTKRFHNFKSCKWFYYFVDYNEWYDDGKDMGIEKNPKRDGDKELEKDKEEDKEYFRPVEFPYLNNLPFKEVWIEWLEVRKKLKVPNTPGAMRRNLIQVHKYDLNIAIKMVEQSVERGYRGIFPVKEKNGYKPPPIRSTPIKKSEPIPERPKPTVAEAAKVSKLVKDVTDKCSA